MPNILTDIYDKVRGINPSSPKSAAPALSSVLGVNGLISAANVNAMGVGWCRIPATWAAIQPTEGAWNWADTDASVAAALGAGMEICLMLFGTPAWALAPGQPTPNPTAVGIPISSAWVTFAAAVAERYASSVKFFQLWNEPMAPYFFNGTIYQYADVVLIPGASAVRSSGGLVVFGGWPVSQWLWPPNANELERIAATQGLYAMLRQNPSWWDAIDVLDLHYQAGNFQTVFTDLISPGAVAKAWGYTPKAYLWQTEIGFTSGAAGATFEALLAWAQTVTFPNQNSVVQFWEAGVGPTDQYLAQVGQATLWPNGQQLVELAGV
jgi:hypothetical protein